MRDCRSCTETVFISSETAHARHCARPATYFVGLPKAMLSSWEETETIASSQIQLVRFTLVGNESTAAIMSKTVQSLVVCVCVCDTLLI